MIKSLLIVESRPQSPHHVAEYRKWYEGTHVAEVLAIEGFASARLLEPLEGDSLLAIYEIEGDAETAKAKLRAAQRSGTMSRPVGMQLDPPPSVRYFRAVNGDA